MGGFKGLTGSERLANADFCCLVSCSFILFYFIFSLIRGISVHRF